MLAALLENNNNARAQPQPHPQIKIDRGGGGPSWPSYEIVDIITATAAFPEIAGEDAVARAVRRQKWIGNALPFIKEAREKQAAAAFMVGAHLADAADEERHAAIDQLKIEQMVAIIDEVRDAAVKKTSTRPVPVPVSHARGGFNEGSGVGLFVGGLVVGGILAGILLSKRSSQQRRFV